MRQLFKTYQNIKMTLSYSHMLAVVNDDTRNCAMILNKQYLDFYFFFFIFPLEIIKYAHKCVFSSFSWHLRSRKMRFLLKWNFFYRIWRLHDPWQHTLSDVKFYCLIDIILWIHNFLIELTFLIMKCRKYSTQINWHQAQQKSPITIRVRCYHQSRITLIP